MLKLVVHSASAKIRDDGVNDDASDLSDPAQADVWSGIVPLRTVFGAPQQDPAASIRLEVPPHVAALVDASCKVCDEKDD